jgi:hypothetical protein
MFRCRTGTTCQSTPPLVWATSGSPKWKEQQDHIPCLESQELPEWHAIVRIYAPRKLTFPGDKFKAIGALADIYRMKTNHTYIAGLWKESLLHDLCWLVDVSERSQAKLSSQNWEPRPLDYRAPSWSWAAVDIHENSLFFFIDEGPHSIVRSTLGMEADAVIVDVALQQTEPSSIYEQIHFMHLKETYGQILSAHLIIEGSTSSVNWYYNLFPRSPSLLPLHEYNTITTRDALEVDWSNDYGACMPVTALVLTRWIETDQTHTTYYIFGLLLVEVAEHIYRRVGTFRSCSQPLPSEGFSGLTKVFQRQTLAII